MTSVLWFLLGVVSAYFIFNLALCKLTYKTLSICGKINRSGWIAIIITFFIGGLACYDAFHKELIKTMLNSLKGLDDGKK